MGAHGGGGGEQEVGQRGRRAVEVREHGERRERLVRGQHRLEERERRRRRRRGAGGAATAAAAEVGGAMWNWGLRRRVFREFSTELGNGIDFSLSRSSTKRRSHMQRYRN